MLPYRFSPLADIFVELHLDVTHYAFDETAVHLLNNRTKSVQGFNDRFELKWEKSNMKFCTSNTLYVNL